MEIKRYEDAAAFEFADFTLRELAPDAVEEASMAEILLPIGADRPPRISRKRHRIYVVLAGEIEFSVNEQSVMLSRGDTLYVAQGEQYGFHNGGYEEGRMLLIRMPGPALPENA
jgi:mannose-6-phosphate isomerase-like protein (cupin superfamily)